MILLSRLTRFCASLSGVVVTSISRLQLFVTACGEAWVSTSGDGIGWRVCGRFLGPTQGANGVVCVGLIGFRSGMALGVWGNHRCFFVLERGVGVWER